MKIKWWENDEKITKREKKKRNEIKCKSNLFQTIQFQSSQQSFNFQINVVHNYNIKLVYIIFISCESNQNCRNYYMFSLKFFVFFFSDFQTKIHETFIENHHHFSFKFSQSLNFFIEIFMKLQNWYFIIILIKSSHRLFISRLFEFSSYIHRIFIQFSHRLFISKLFELSSYILFFRFRIKLSQQQYFTYHIFDFSSKNLIFVQSQLSQQLNLLFEAFLQCF